jgi:hypothetical protein
VKGYQETRRREAISFSIRGTPFPKTSLLGLLTRRSRRSFRKTRPISWLANSYFDLQRIREELAAAGFPRFQSRQETRRAGPPPRTMLPSLSIKERHSETTSKPAIPHAWKKPHKRRLKHSRGDLEPAPSQAGSERISSPRSADKPAATYACALSFKDTRPSHCNGLSSCSYDSGCLYLRNCVE